MLKMSTKFKKNNLKNLKKRIREIDGQHIKYGYFKEQGQHTYADMYYVDLMAIHEYGSVDAGFGVIPPRPVFQIAINEIKVRDYKTVLRPLESMFNRIGGDKSVDQVLDRIGYNFARKTQSIFGSDKLADNSPATIDSKGFNSPLIWTGELSANMAYETSQDSKFKVVG